MHYCASLIVAFSLSHATLYFGMNALQECKTRQIAMFRGYLKLYMLDLKPIGGAKWSNCAQIQGLCTRKFSWHKSLTYPECAELSLVYCSVHETCAERFFLHRSVNVIRFQYTFRTCVHNLSNPDSHLWKPIVPIVTHYAQERTFPWHPCNLFRMSIVTHREL